MIDLVACVRTEVVHADGTVFERYYDWQGGEDRF